MNIVNSSINASAATSVILSLNQGEVNLNNNSFKISGEKGRIAELFSMKGSLVSNIFKSSLRKSSNVTAIYTDSNSNVSQNKNDSYGF